MVQLKTDKIWKMTKVYTKHSIVGKFLSSIPILCLFVWLLTDTSQAIESIASQVLGDPEDVVDELEGHDVDTKQSKTASSNGAANKLKKINKGKLTKKLFNSSYMHSMGRRNSKQTCEVL